MGDRTINIRVTAEDIGDLLEIINYVIEDIEMKDWDELEDYDVSMEDMEKEKICYPICEIDKRKCSCFQDEIGCDNYHRLKEERVV